MITVAFERAMLRDVGLKTPEMGETQVDMEVVTRLTVGDRDVWLSAPGMQAKYQTPEELPTQTQTMSRHMAQRLLDFCGLTFFVGNNDYDCHAFVGFLMGWQDTVAARSASLQPGSPAIYDLDSTQANTPYTGRAPTSSTQHVHSFLGSERQGYNFGVVGPGLPLVFSKTSDLTKLYGVTELYELQPYSPQRSTLATGQQPYPA